jgi:hypothetical protein
MREPGSDLHDGKKHDIDRQRDASPIPIAHQAEEKSSQGSHCETCSKGEHDVTSWPMKFTSHLAQNVGKDKKVERIKRPAEEPGQKRVSAILIPCGMQ